MMPLSSVPTIRSIATTATLPLAVLTLLALACGETTTTGTDRSLASSTPGEPVAVPASIEVSPEGVQLETGQAQQFTAVVRDQRGEVIDSPVSWDATGGSITSRGLYTAGANAGDYSVRASSGDVSATAMVRITQAAAVPTSIEVRPQRTRLTPGGTQQFSAVVRDQEGEVIDSPVRWQATGGTITAGGLYTAGSAGGDYVVRASSGEVSDTADVRITESAPSPPSSDVAMLAAWGCSQVTHEWNAFERRPPPFNVWTGFHWGGMALSNWHSALETGRRWRDFAKLVASNPTTSDVYAEICIRASDRISETEYRRMAEAVFREIRSQVGPGVRVWATGMADWEGEVCSSAGPEGAEIAGRMADHVVSLGLALRGPTITPWRLNELEDDLCHPNDRGEDRAAAEIVDFYTD